MQRKKGGREREREREKYMRFMASAYGFSLENQQNVYLI